MSEPGLFGTPVAGVESFLIRCLGELVAILSLGFDIISFKNYPRR